MELEINFLFQLVFFDIIDQLIKITLYFKYFKKSIINFLVRYFVLFYVTKIFFRNSRDAYFIFQKNGMLLYDFFRSMDLFLYLHRKSQHSLGNAIILNTKYRLLLKTAFSLIISTTATNRIGVLILCFILFQLDLST